MRVSRFQSSGSVRSRGPCLRRELKKGSGGRSVGPLPDGRGSVRLVAAQFFLESSRGGFSPGRNRVGLFFCCASFFSAAFFWSCSSGVKAASRSVFSFLS